MTALRSKPFELAVWGRIRPVLRASVLGWKEYKRRRWARWLSSGGVEDHFALRLLASFFLLLMFVGLVGGMSERAEGFLVLWVTGSIFRRASLLNSALYRSPRLHVFNHLPIANGQIFHEQIDVWWKLSHGVILDLGIVSAALYRPDHWSNHMWAGLVFGLVCGLIQWLFVMSAAIAVAAWKPRQNFDSIGALLLLLAFLYAFDWVPDSVAWGVFSIRGLLPPGSLVILLLSPVGLWSASGLMAVCLYAGGLVYGWLCLRRLQQQYCLTDLDYDAERRLTRQFSAARAGKTAVTEAPAQSEAEAEAALRARLKAPGFDWAGAQVVERAVGKALDARERTVAELLVRGDPNWTPRLKWMAICSALALLVLGWDKDIAFLLMLPVLLMLCYYFGAWGGFGISYTAGCHVPPHAWYPVGIREACWTMIKINWVRGLFCVPLLILVLLALISQWHLSESMAFWIGAKLVYLGIVLQPMFAVFLFHHSQGSLLREFISLMASAALIITSMAVVLSFAFVTNPTFGMVLGLVLVVLDILVMLVWQSWLNRGRVDFVLKAPAGVPSVEA